MADECSVDGIRKQRGRYKDNSCIILILISSQQQGGKAQAEEVSTKRVDREPFPKMAPTELSACSMFRMLQRSPRYSSRPHVSLQTCQMIMRSLLNEFRKQTCNTLSGDFCCFEEVQDEDEISQFEFEETHDDGLSEDEVLG